MYYLNCRNNYKVKDNKDENINVDSVERNKNNKYKVEENNKEVKIKNINKAKENKEVKSKN